MRLLFAQEVLTTLGYNIDAIADPIAELKNVIEMGSGLRVRNDNFEESLLEGLGYRTDAITPELFEEAIYTLVEPYRTDAEADPRDLIAAKAMDEMGQHVIAFTDEITAKVEQWQKDGLSLEEISDRIDSIYSSPDYQGKGFVEELAGWLAIAYLGGVEAIGEEV